MSSVPDLLTHRATSFFDNTVMRLPNMPNSPVFYSVNPQNSRAPKAGVTYI